MLLRKLGSEWFSLVETLLKFTKKSNLFIVICSFNCFNKWLIPRVQKIAFIIMNFKSNINLFPVSPKSMLCSRIPTQKSLSVLCKVTWRSTVNTSKHRPVSNIKTGEYEWITLRTVTDWLAGKNCPQQLLILIMCNEYNVKYNHVQLIRLNRSYW